jgi:ankyrin repeat protein
MGGGEPWVAAPRAKREALTLEAIKLAAESGVDLNAANTDGRTALDEATALGYESVVSFLRERGAVAGRPAKRKGG